MRGDTLLRRLKYTTLVERVGRWIIVTGPGVHTWKPDLASLPLADTPGLILTRDSDSVKSPYPAIRLYCPTAAEARRLFWAMFEDGALNAHAREKDGGLGPAGWTGGGRMPLRPGPGDLPRPLARREAMRTFRP